MTYRLLPLSVVEKYVAEAAAEGVSEIARGPAGFLQAYRKYGRRLPEEWKKKRDAFIARSFAAYKMQPTNRRKLSLIMWAFMP